MWPRGTWLVLLLAGCAGAAEPAPLPPADPAPVDLGAEVPRETPPRTPPATPTERLIETVGAGPPPEALGEALGHPVAHPLPGDEPSPPSAPTRAELSRALEAIAPAVAACAGEERGSVTLAIELAGPTGRVLRTHPDTTELSPGAVRCVRDAVSTLSVAPFELARFELRYPFHLGD